MSKVCNVKILALFKSSSGKKAKAMADAIEYFNSRNIDFSPAVINIFGKRFTPIISFEGINYVPMIIKEDLKESNDYIILSRKTIVGDE